MRANLLRAAGVLSDRSGVNTVIVSDRRFRHGDLAFRVRSTVRRAASPETGRTAGTTRDDASGAALPPVVLIHGLGTSHRSNRRLHDELAHSASVYSIDLPGFGALPTPAGSHGVPDLAHALAGVLDRLRVQGTILIGHSMGAQWVTELAVQRPDLVNHLVVIAPVTDPGRRSAYAQARALARDVLGESITANVIVFSDYLRCQQRWYLAQLSNMLEYRIEDRVGSLRMPLLVLRGGDDPVANEVWCRVLRDRARIGLLVTIPNHRHVVQHTAPRAVASAIRAFVAQRVDSLVSAA